jgi:hypothetical protein
LSTLTVSHVSGLTQLLVELVQFCHEAVSPDEPALGTRARVGMQRRSPSHQEAKWQIGQGCGEGQCSYLGRPVAKPLVCWTANPTE